MKHWIAWVAMALMASSASFAADLKVSALHPLMADLARQVGGEGVKVFDLVGEGGNPHRFEPRPSDLKTMRESALVLAGGKHLEPYLDRLKSALGGVTVVERAVYDVEVTAVVPSNASVAVTTRPTAS